MTVDLLETILDLAFIGLLVAVLIYAVRLNRNIGVLRESKEELQALMGQFVSSTERAEEALQRIRNRSRDATISIDDAITEAKSLKLELKELIHRAEEVAGPVGMAAAKAERGQSTYRPGFTGGPAKQQPKRSKKARSKKASAAKPAPASPISDEIQMSQAELDGEIDKDLEARLAKLIESVEAGDPAVGQPQADMLSQSSLLEEEDAPVVEEANAQETKAKSKEDLLKALRGMK